MKLLNKLLKAGDGKRLKQIKSVVEPVANLADEYKALSDDDLAAKTGEFKTRLDNGAELDDLLPEAFATVKETADRVIGQRHYDVQVMGGAALHWGWVAEMKTGEGKTLCSTLPIYLNAITGNGVHVITVNEYLASFHAEWMGQIQGFLGLSTGLVVPGNNDQTFKRAQYAADITYGTNNEFGFDYLRDNMARSKPEMVQRGHSYAIVDEIDSILIDEARTPLIISGKVRGAADLYVKFAGVVRQLERDVHYDVDEEKRQVAITDDGISAVEEILEIENLYDGVQGDLVHQLNAALRAKELFHRDKDYLINGGEVKIVDEFTGRVLDGRRWSDGLHQAVEAKEGVAIKEEQQTLATVTLQNYFRMYNKLSGMTGTAMTDAAELETTYNLPVVQVPTNRPLIRADEPDLIYKSETSKFGACIDDIVERVAKGQPVLVGTASVAKSEVLSDLMTKRGVEHEVLNAKQHFREAEIVAQAGQAGAVTVATNMAGRGVDILLGGNPEKLAERDARNAKISPEDDNWDEFVADRLAYWEPVCAEQGDAVRESGGLYVLATERHESRRIDNQLRGRAGRQGDPGESRFYLSLEDDLMRIFATGAMSWVMDKALPDDVPIESGMVTKSVERAQNTVEQRNAEIRKNVLDYDEVYNQQRKVIYGKRAQILEEGDLKTSSLEAIRQVAEVVVANHCPEQLEDSWDLDGLATELHTYWPSELSHEDLVNCSSIEELEELIESEGVKFYEQREEELGEPVMRQIERQVMLQLIDQRWREHLAEMDELRGGINLRAMGQRDPLIEWQREGFDLFAGMITGLNTDFVRYLMHVKVVQKPQQPAVSDVTTETAAKTQQPDFAAVSKAKSSQGTPAPTPAGDAPATKPSSSRPAIARPTATNVSAAKADAASLIGKKAPEPVADEKAKPVVKSDWDKTPRNAPCPCESGKKFKHCHGR